MHTRLRFCIAARVFDKPGGIPYAPGPLKNEYAFAVPSKRFYDNLDITKIIILL